ncbi:hypothetical protein [Spirosoma spitsbergense]|uniref:hypothetical protein n=1 Tax=Spirosoma spitsbergense TaxID=431554 RepID=UPI00037A82D2|nr:hypothetical protein [Spirosoma spitsbergense]
MKKSFFAALLVAAPLSLTSIQAQNTTVQFAALKTATLTAQDVLDKHMQALGGTEKIGTLKSVILKQITLAQTQEIRQTLYILPGKGVRSEMNTMGFEITIAARGDSGWQVNPAMYGNQQPVALPAKEARAVCAQADLFGPLASAKALGHEVTYGGDEKIDGELCHKLTATTLSGSQYTGYISTKSYMLVKLITKSMEVYYSDYQKVGDYWFPHLVEIISGGNKASLTDRHFEVNKSINDDLFNMPSAN